MFFFVFIYKNVFLLFELFEVLFLYFVMSSRIIFIIITSLKLSDQFIILIEIILILSASLTTAIVIFVVLSLILGMKIFWKLMFISFSREVDAFLIIVSTEFIKTVLIKEIAIGIIET